MGGGSARERIAPASGIVISVVVPHPSRKGNGGVDWVKQQTPVVVGFPVQPLAERANSPIRTIIPNLRPMGIGGTRRAALYSELKLFGENRDWEVAGCRLGG